MLPNVTRRAAVATVASTLVAAGRPAFAQSGLTTVRMGTMPNDAEGEPFYGAEAGTWQAAGVNPEITYFATGANIVTALLAGDIDVGIANPMSVAIAVAHNIPLQALAPGNLVSKRVAYPNVVVAADSPLKSPKDLAGATIGVSEIGSFNYYSVLVWLGGYGVAPSSVKFVELPFSEVGLALQRSRIQAAFLVEPFTSRLLAAGQIRLFGSSTYLAIAPELSVAIWCCARSWVKNNPNAVKKFFTGLYATAKWCNAHQAQTGAILVKVAKLEPATLASVKRTYFAERPDKAYLDPILQMANKYGALARPVSYAEFTGTGT